MPRQPTAKTRPWRRLAQPQPGGAATTNYGLAAGQAFTNTGIRYEIIPVFGQCVLTVRAKVTGAGATLGVVFVGPDVDPDVLTAAKDTAYASIVGTLYSTLNPANVTLVADTENSLQAVCNGEGYALVKLTGGGSGTIKYVDVAFQDRPIILLAP